ncbi:uncharacterized protein G2W53_033560 [Senna tora]|uniref:Uncharacterized protein n=1 Tax=Senna tora TaxID=362788 RepID=A0A834WCY1_9FABA|nr:uncharacterized protein G2W53_033560 [Senna tora]
MASRCIWESEWIYCSNGNRDHMEEFKKYKFNRVVAQESQTDRFALYFGIQVDVKLEWDSR